MAIVSLADERYGLQQLANAWSDLQMPELFKIPMEVDPSGNKVLMSMMTLVMRPSDLHQPRISMMVCLSSTASAFFLIAPAATWANTCDANIPSQLGVLSSEAQYVDMVYRYNRWKSHSVLLERHGLCLRVLIDTWSWYLAGTWTWSFEERPCSLSMTDLVVVGPGSRVCLESRRILDVIRALKLFVATFSFVPSFSLTDITQSRLQPKLIGGFVDVSRILSFSNIVHECVDKTLTTVHFDAVDQGGCRWNWIDMMAPLSNFAAKKRIWGRENSTVFSYKSMFGRDSVW